MNAKQIVAVSAVIVLLVGGLVGLGFAYQATTTNTGNTETSQYLLISTNDGGSSTTASYAEDFTNVIKFNTVNANGSYSLDSTTPVEGGWTSEQASTTGSAGNIKIVDLGTIDIQVSKGADTTATQYTLGVWASQAVASGYTLYAYVGDTAVNMKVIGTEQDDDTFAAAAIGTQITLHIAVAFDTTIINSSTGVIASPFSTATTFNFLAKAVVE